MENKLQNSCLAILKVKVTEGRKYCKIFPDEVLCQNGVKNLKAEIYNINQMSAVRQQDLSTFMKAHPIAPCPSQKKQKHFN